MNFVVKKIVMDMIAITCALAIVVPAALADSYTYDNAGRLISIEYSDGSSATYTYDAAGNLLNRTVNAVAAGPLAAALLPTSRSGVIGNPVSAFVTLINAGQGNAVSCSISLNSSLNATFSYQTTNTANALIGTKNTPANIPAGGFQSYLVTVTPNEALPSSQVGFDYDCTNTDSAGVLVGLNTLLLSASATPTPDVIALAATTSNDGIIALPGNDGASAFAVATVNVGVVGSITARAVSNASINLLVCETDPNTSDCIDPASATVTTSIAAQATPTFGIFVFATGEVPFNPVDNRVFVEFVDGGGVVRGSTSVAVRTD